jgi:aminoglycoside 6-adenylyltransferase
MQPSEEETLNRIIQWGESRPEVRALLLTSTRAVPDAKVDRLSDYDVIVAVSDEPGIAPFHESRQWLEAFGHVLVLYRDPILHWFGPESAVDQSVNQKFGYVTQYEEHGMKIDFTLMPASLLRRIAQSPLPEDLDLGYRVLLDKDGLTAFMAPPTHRAYIPSPPSQAEYLESIELFFHECTYLAKYLWRDDLVPAKAQLDSSMKMDHLREMLEWRAEIDAGWTLRLKAHGRGLQKIVPPDLWAELEATYVGASIAENWVAMWRTIDLFEKVARQVGAALGYTYPEDMHRRSVKYFRWVQELPYP